MQLSPKTLEVLKNFSKFNQNILLPEGNTIKTMTDARNLFGSAVIEESFPREVPIYNLIEFLSALKLFDKPTLEFLEDRIVIRDSNSQVQYHYADKSVLTYPQKEIKLPAANVTFNLPSVQLQKVLNAASTLSLSSISLLNENGKLLLRAHNADNESTNKYDIILGDDTTGYDKFVVHFKLDTLQLLEYDYVVELSFKGIARFSNAAEKLEYMVGLQPATVPAGV
jgi:hypothetical protein